MIDQKCACNQLFSIIVTHASGAEHREFGFPISTNILSWRGPKIEADKKFSIKNVQVGGGAEHREFRKEIQQILKYTLAAANVYELLHNE
ncbi:hypothetical protein RA295_08735 [Staphylococcus aureus]|uniref:hypothetical protein n=1 Tax=Staphylococcus aureus TaxID=1280 RepID=UPI001362C032|nr:hypothetical protein [Staphylococcus aureus]MCJ8110682.1 hypothetical protein [Staphylococcus aureus]MDQ1881749.1 hypothetical protein [Staphylococcus aureus]QHK50593.1 hypothetical protein E3S88_08595 [Staphylococcus aureus]HCV3557344.1 hypothetical protein [Staphylococcus aureus]HCZ5728619.1 hypothetical protein [Staphylococcus aureus]